MLYLVLLYFIGKKFYELADEYGKKSILFGVLGALTYVFTTFCCGVILGIIGVLIESDFIQTSSSFVLELIVLPFGLLGCYSLYKFLDKKWKEDKPNEDNLIDQIGNS